ncbi:hypothetical protein K438DRAFT_1828188 [Mycena galopus ATCC 62051]|nr:hypothetical protein K438DRAFT_1828188 [Mycena galopus ATCC 62051]
MKDKSSASSDRRVTNSTADSAGRALSHGRNVAPSRSCKHLTQTESTQSNNFASSRSDSVNVTSKRKTNSSSWVGISR